MVPITRRATCLKKKKQLINYEPILICSTQAAGIVLDMFAGEAGEGDGGKEETKEATSTAQARVSASLHFNFYRKTLTRACVLETDVRINIYIYISRASIDLTK